MISVKNSFANCSICQLLESPSCILETNSKVDLTKVEIVFVAENPGKEEVKKKPEPAPLVGRSGQMFRKYFQKYNLHKTKYLLTNTVLCQTLNPDGTTGNPEPDVIEKCKINCMEIIRECKPKLIVLMGTSPMNAFGIAKAGITNIHGNIFDWEGFPVLLTVHPSFVNRNVKLWEPKFEEDMAKVAQIMEGDSLTVINVTKVSEEKEIGKGIHRYKIPEKFYTDEYRLVDVQFLNRKQQVLYIFRDKDNNKIYHTESDEYICYQSPPDFEARKIVPYDELKQISLHYKDRYSVDPDITYEGDLKITTKHAMDYYHFNKGDAPKVQSNIMFFDIEIDTGKEKIFPKSQEARFPINMFTSIYNGVKTFYGVDNKTEPIEKIAGVNYKIFDNEKKMLYNFMKDFKDTDPDFIAGWNLISFDMEYIFNRLPQLGMLQTSMTKFNEFYIDGSRYIAHMPGCVAIDQDYLYRTFTFTKMENYKLVNIAAHELDGFTKIPMPLPFNEMYWKMLNKTVEYNIRDTELLELLDDKLAHINLLNELRIICNTSFDSVSSMGQIDSLMVSYLRSKGIASKNADPHVPKEKYPGAYVYEPTPGIYEDITDFDFASLYPNLMITYNIGVNSFVMKTKNPHLGYELAYDPEKLPENIEMIVDPLYEKKSCTMTYKELHKLIQDNALIHTINGCFFEPHKKKFSVFGEVVDLLMTSRKEYKNQMFKEEDESPEYKFFYTRQLVYKVLANTLYGVVANKTFRFFDLSLAAAITLTGQEALKTSIIEGDAKMRSLATEQSYVKPNTLTKAEMFADPKTQPDLYKLPDRSREFIITGDTDSIFCKFENFPQEKTVSNIHGWCKEIESFLNKDKIVDMVKRHNVDLEFNKLILKNELVISRGLFLAKKRYAIRVVNNEGKDVDKINYMGVEIKRSDYPSKSKEFLSELSELLLKSEKLSFPKIMSFIDASKRDFLSLIKEGNKSVSRPVSWGKKLEDYKTLTQGVRSMLAWNEIMYECHKTGVKGYMYWVKGIDIDKAPDDVLQKYHKFTANGGKLEVIAIPDEEEKLPHYFIPDVHSALKFTFEDRHELFLKPLFREVEKQKNEVILF